MAPWPPGVAGAASPALDIMEIKSGAKIKNSVYTYIINRIFILQKKMLIRIMCEVYTSLYSYKSCFFYVILEF